MNHVLSTHLFASHRLTTVWLDRIWRASIPAVEIFCAKQHLDWHDRAQIRELGHWFRDAPLKVHSLHTPMYNDEYWGRSGPQSIITITDPVKSKRLPMVDELKRSIEIAETVPFQYAIVHLGVPGEEWSEHKVEAAFTALEEISLFARARGVEVLLENTPNALASAERLQLFNIQTHLNLNYCFDVGHAHMNEGVENAFRIMKERIRSTHLHDNSGAEDQHLFPLTLESGGIDWRRTMDLLRPSGAQFPLLLELKEVAELAQPIDAARETFDKLENLKPREEDER